MECGEFLSPPGSARSMAHNILTGISPGGQGGQQAQPGELGSAAAAGGLLPENLDL